MRHTAWLVVGVFSLILPLGCAGPVTPTFPYAIEIASPEPTIDISNCSTVICCADCMAIDVDRIIDGDTFHSANARIRLFGLDTPERGEKCFTEATQRF
jgi:endonuclease YncB( thermonuclease family)